MQSVSQINSFSPCSSSPCMFTAAELTFNWVKTDYDRIHKRLGLTSMMLFGSIVRISGMGFVSTAKAAEVPRHCPPCI